MYETTGPIKLKGGLLKNKVAKQAGGGGLCKKPEASKAKGWVM